MIVTNGAGSALDLLAHVLADPGGLVSLYVCMHVCKYA